MSLHLKIISLSLLLTLTSCANLQQNIQQNKEMVIGCGLGAGIGALVGNKLGGKRGAYVGGGLGAFVGCQIGYQYQQRRQALAKIAQQQAMSIQFSIIETVKNEKSGKEQFLVVDDSQQKNKHSTSHRTGKDQPKKTQNTIGLSASIANADGKPLYLAGSVLPTSQSEAKIKQLAQAFKGSDKNILIIGHTDSSGDPEQNQQLSERRAQYISKLFAQSGIPVQRLYFQGAGATQPRSTNQTAQGRAKNRRIEVVEIDGRPDKLMDYANHQQAEMKYLALRSQDKVMAMNTQKLTSTSSTYQGGRSNRNNSAQQPSKVQDLNPQNHFPKVNTVKPKVDFAGKPMKKMTSDFYARIGLKADKGFSLFKHAYADEALGLNCAIEGRNLTGKVKNLKTGQIFDRNHYKTSEFLPGLFGTVWSQKMNGHYVALSPVAVLENNGESVSNPKLKIWTHYSQSKTRAKADYDVDTEVETYYGDKGLLYRVFPVSSQAPFRCIDLLLPIENSTQAIDGVLFYDKNHKINQTTFAPSLLTH